MIDRSEAVNLARNVLEHHERDPLTTKGQLSLAEAVMRMDAELKRLYALRPEGGPTWKHAGNPEDLIELPDGTPVEPGTTLYTFDERGTWFYDLPSLPQGPK